MSGNELGHLKHRNAFLPLNTDLSFLIDTKSSVDKDAKLIPVDISIDQDSIVLVNGAPYSSPTDRKLSDLVDRLTAIIAANRFQPVVVDPLPTTTHQRVMDVLGVCIAAGVKDLYLGKWPYPAGPRLPPVRI